jgi:hypothetical protein
MAGRKQVGKRHVRWFRTLQEKNRPPYRYYQHSLGDA